MPIGTSKLGVLGAGVVPGGTQTFNASGTFSVPPGVSRVNITGRGGTGNPGNAGNSGNPGNPGTGGAGGSGGAPASCCACVDFASFGGIAYFTTCPSGGFNTCPCNTNIAAKTGPRGGPAQANAGTAQSGQTGNAGNSGSAGNPGNPGNASSGLGNTFPGGAGGNAGVAGAAGNGGAGGAGGGGGGGYQNRNPGPGGTGGGNGGAGASLQAANRPTPSYSSIVVGGGGAGVTNSGQNGIAAQWFNAIAGSPNPLPTPLVYAPTRVGGSGNPAVTSPLPTWCAINFNPSITTATMGGGAIGQAPILAGAASFTLNYVNNGPGFQPGFPLGVNRTQINQVNCSTARPEIFRSGGGGGGSRRCGIGGSTAQLGGAGGGGGRGAAGNAGGSSPTPSGSAGTPQTFNCVPVIPGSPYPITVGGPTGGQIVISWNPQ